MESPAVASQPLRLPSSFFLPAPILKERADFVIERPHGEGVAELIDQFLANNFRPGGVKPS